MAISFDTSGQDNDAQFATFNMTAAEADEIAIMFVIYNDANTLTGPTVNASSTGVTQIGSDFTDFTGIIISAWHLVDPSQSSVAYAANVNNSDNDITLFASLFKGVDQDSPIDSNNTGFAVSSSIVLSTTVVAANAWLASIYKTTGAGSNGVQVDSGGIERQEFASNGIGDSNATVGTGSQSMTWQGNRVNSGGIIVSLAPLAAGPANLKSWNGLAVADIKSINGLAIADIKSINSLE